MRTDKPAPTSSLGNQPAPSAALDPALQAIEQAVWRELLQAPQQRDHGWRHWVMASQCAEGVDARTLVLRECDDVARSLVFYTDARSPKLRQLEQAPRAVLVAWSASLGWQLRLVCRVEVATHGLGVSSRWARIRHTPAAQDYLFPLPSGTALPSAAAGAGGSVVTAAAPQAPLPATLEHHHFAVMTATIEAIDWLELGAPRHRRARFVAGRAEWLAP